MRRALYMALSGAAAALFGFVWFRAAMALGVRAEPMRRAGLALGRGLCRLWSLIPVPVSELVWLLGPLTAIGLAVGLTVKRGLGGLGLALSIIIMTGGIIYALAAVVFLGQYSAPPLADTLGLAVEKHSDEELYGVAVKLARELNDAAERVPRDDSGVFVMESYDRVTREAMTAYEQSPLAELYARGPKRPPKKSLIFAEAMSYLNISGYYFAPTGESIVSCDNTSSSIPFTVAHELAHAFGIGPEKEANFSAFLCCISSGDPELRYSGLMSGYVYLHNALYSSNRELWQSLYSTLSEPVLRDMDAKREHLKKYEGKINELGSSVNDAFIKSTGQSEGLRSYGLAADLILSWYLSRPTAD